LEVLNSYSRKPFVFESLLHLLPLACLLPAFFNYLIIRRRVQDRREFGQTQHS
jgi:hypothetical protein